MDGQSRFDGVWSEDLAGGGHGRSTLELKKGQRGSSSYRTLKGSTHETTWEKRTQTTRYKIMDAGAAMTPKRMKDYRRGRFPYSSESQRTKTKCKYVVKTSSQVQAKTTLLKARDETERNAKKPGIQGKNHKPRGRKNPASLMKKTEREKGDRSRNLLKTI